MALLVWPASSVSNLTASVFFWKANEYRIVIIARRFRDVFYVEGNERGRGGKAQAADARTRPRRAAYAALDARPSSTAACARRRDAGRHAEP